MATDGNMDLDTDDMEVPRSRYIAPPADQLQQLREERNDLIQEIYRMAEQSHVSGVETKASGVAKQWNFEAQGNQVLADFALNCFRVPGINIPF